MTFEVILAPTAEVDLLNIGKFIAQDNLEKALEWMDLLEERSRTLEAFPMRGVRYKKQYRMYTVDNGYRIFYRVEQSEKLVIVLHFYSPYQNYAEDMKDL